MEKVLSVIVPVYNGEKYLTELLQSIEPDLNDEVELILINDGSEDNSEVICCDFRNKYPKSVKYIYKENSGVCNTRNVGLEQSQGRYITFADQDDYFVVGGVRSLLEKAKTASADMIIYEPFIAEENHNPRRLEIPVNEGIYRDEDLMHIIIAMLFGTMNGDGKGFNIGMWNCLLSRKKVKESGVRFDPYLRMGEDIVFIAQFLGVCDTAEIWKKTLYNWRVNYSSVSHTYKKNEWLAVVKSVYIFDRVTESLKKWPEEFWREYTAKRYAGLIVSMAKNQADPRGKESLFKIRKTLKRMYKEPAIKDSLKYLNFSNMNRRDKTEMFFVKYHLYSGLICYARIFGLLKKLKLNLQRKG